MCNCLRNGADNNNNNNNYKYKYFQWLYLSNIYYKTEDIYSRSDNSKDLQKIGKI